MTDLRHYDHDGRARFITFSTHQRLPVLSSGQIRDIIEDRLLNCCFEEHVRLLAYCVMPEHVHLVGIPPIEMKMGLFIGRVKMLSAHEIHQLYTSIHSSLLTKLSTIRDGERRFTFWMRRCYDFNCRSDEDVQEKVEYCHNNPVKRKLVAAPELWQWSSYKYYQNMGTELQEFDIAKIAHEQRIVR